MDELVDILTEGGNKIGKSISKAIAHETGVCHGIAAVALIGNDGKILIQKRASVKKDEPNKWDLSGAGHIDLEETPEQAAIREIYEELGIKIKKEELVLIDTFLNKVELDSKIKLNHYTYLFLVKKDVSQDRIKMQEAEVSEIRFVNKKEFLELKNSGYMVKAIKHCDRLLDFIN